MLSNVDLPEPEGPVTATDSPALTVRLTSRRASTSRAPRAYTLATPWSARAGGRSSARATDRPGVAAPDETQHLLDRRARPAAAVHDHVGAQDRDQRGVGSPADVQH